MSRTLWEQGRQPGRLVVHAAALGAAALAVLDLLLAEDLTWRFDVGFVLLCLAAALLVRPRDFFMVGVLPPLLMAGVVGGLALVERTAVADPRDGFAQAVVSGLAHHAGALVAGYALTLGVLALRQTARRNHGRIRGAGRRSGRPAPRRSLPAGRSAARAPSPDADRVAAAGCGEPHLPVQREARATAGIGDRAAR